jgi:hypothetical protein
VFQLSPQQKNTIRSSVFLLVHNIFRLPEGILAIFEYIFISDVDHLIGTALYSQFKILFEATDCESIDNQIQQRRYRSMRTPRSVA